MASNRQNRLRKQRILASTRFTKPISILLLGRTRRKLNGGIAKSAKMIFDHLRRLGNNIVLRDVRSDISPDYLKTFHIILHYGEEDNLEQQITAAKIARVPIVVNSVYDGHSDRISDLGARLKKWNDGSSNVLFFSVFSEGAKNHLNTACKSDRFVVLPKTIVFKEVESKPFEERSGICIGEAAKLDRVRITRGVDVQKIVDGLLRVSPTIYCYNQYKTEQTKIPDGVQIKEYTTSENFLGRLSGLRLFVSITKWETFSMVPIEAQSVGTPVLFRAMPQSLNEYIGSTGVVWENPEELFYVARILYNDPIRWTQISNASMLNARSKTINNLACSLDIAVRKILLQYNLTKGK